MVVVGLTDAFSNFKSRTRSVGQCFYKQNLLRIHQKNVILQGIFHSKTWVIYSYEKTIQVTLTPAATSNLAVYSHIECGLVIVDLKQASHNFKSCARSAEQCFHIQKRSKKCHILGKF